MRRAQVAPELADVDSLLKQLEKAIAHLPELMHLSGEVPLMEPASSRKARTLSRKQPQETIVAPVENAALLTLLHSPLEQLERGTKAQKQQVLAIAHDEDVSRWIEAIAGELQMSSTGQTPA